jgi:hypothetical protein
VFSFDDDCFSSLSIDMMESVIEAAVGIPEDECPKNKV